MMAKSCGSSRCSSATSLPNGDGSPESLRVPVFTHEISRRGARLRLACSKRLVIQCGLGMVVLFPSGESRAQLAIPAHVPDGIILGVVTDSSLRPLGQAEVAILSTRTQVSSNADGRFQFSIIRPGNYALRVRRFGFHATTADVVVQAGDTLRLTVILHPLAVELARVNVTASRASLRLRSFEERRAKSTGVFFSGAEIEARNAVSTVDILRQVMGLRVVAAGSRQFAMSARQASPCPMQVYVDGLPMSGVGPDVPFDLNQLPSPKETMGIEVYSGAAAQPAWLPTGPSSGKRSCGAVLIWTKDGSG